MPQAKSVGIILSVAGGLSVSFALSMEPGLFAIRFRSFLATVAILLLLFGILMITSNDWRPLTPNNSLLAPFSVLSIVALIFLVDVSQLGLDNLSVIIASTLISNVLVIVPSLGVPLGATFRYQQWGKRTGIIMLAMLVIATTIFAYLPEVTTPINIAIFVLSSSVAICLGYFMARPRALRDT